MRIEVAGEQVELLAERALLWMRTHTLLVADPHFGKAATFRAHGIPVPEATTAATIARLERAIERTAARRVIFLGDFMHHRTGSTAATLAALAAFRARYTTLDLVLIRGNHDAHAGDPPENLRIRCMDRLKEGPYVFVHEPAPCDDGYAIGGHIHPAYLLSDGRGSVRLPCFLFGAATGVLPAFGEFTGAFTVCPAPGDRPFVIADDRVLAVPPRAQ